MPEEHAEDDCVIGDETVARQAALEQRHVAGAVDVNEEAGVEVGEGEGVGHCVAEHRADHAGVRYVTAPLVTMHKAAGETVVRTRRHRGPWLQSASAARCSSGNRSRKR